MNANIFEKANRIVKETGEAAFGLVDEEGAPTVSMISSIRTDGIFQAVLSIRARVSVMLLFARRKRRLISRLTTYGF